MNETVFSVYAHAKIVKTGENTSFVYSMPF